MSLMDSKNWDGADWMIFVGSVTLAVALIIALAQAPGCVIAYEQEKTKRFGTTVIVQPCEGVLRSWDDE